MEMVLTMGFVACFVSLITVLSKLSELMGWLD